MGSRAFLVTIDIEGDNPWARPPEITCRNAAFLPRFQELCDNHGFKSTCLANYEMAMEDTFVASAHSAMFYNNEQLDGPQ
jgi:hypothetical protein